MGPLTGHVLAHSRIPVCDSAVNKPEHEVYLGGEVTRAKIAQSLYNLRARPLTAADIAKHLHRVRGTAQPPQLDAVIPLTAVSYEPARANIDGKLWRDVIAAASAELSQLNAGSTMLRPDRFLVGVPSARSDDTGGFHSDHGVGFQYLSYFAYASLLNNNVSSNPAVRTLELARNYFHDSLHAATFRSFGMNEQGEPYRFQYGINFRTEKGQSYSAKRLMDCVPYGINLNLLMDGLIVGAVSTVLEPFCSDVAKVPLNPHEREIVRELSGDAGQTLLPQIKQFYNDVTWPSNRFLGYWGSNALRTELLRGMLTGNLEGCQEYFKGAIEHRYNNDDRGLETYLAHRRGELRDATHNPTAWEALFVAPEYLLSQKP